MQIKRFAISLVAICGLIISLSLFAQPAVGAESINECKGSNCLDAVSQQRGGKGPLGIPEVTLGNLASRVVGVLSAAAGALSVIYLILGGIKYSSSNGDSGRIQSAKNTITYAIIGLVVSITAGAIVGFVLSSSPSG